MDTKDTKKKSSGRKGGIMIHLSPELEKVVDQRAADLRANIPGVGESIIGRKEAIQNMLATWPEMAALAQSMDDDRE